MSNVSSGRLLRKILKITAWTLMAMVLAVAALTMCFLRLVSSETLTLITDDACNKLLDAEVKVGKVALSSRSGMPVLTVDVDSVVVLSSPMLRLDAETRAAIPQWGDTLFTLTHFKGGINLLALLRHKIDLYDVEFDEPEINLVALNDSVTNYYIYDYHPDSPRTTTLKMPAVAINRFSIKRPKPLKFHNVMTGNHFNLNLDAMEITGGDKPVYSLQMGGDMNSPMLALYNTSRLNFGVDGHMGWKPESPTELELNNFSLRANFLNALVSAKVDFGREIVVEDYSMSLQETKVEDLLSLVPDSLRIRFGLTPGRLSTGCQIGANISSTAPFNLNTDSVPCADLVITLSPGYLRYDNVNFSDVSGEIVAALRGNVLDDSYFRLNDFKIAGDAFDGLLNLNLTGVASDPMLSGTLSLSGVLQQLPAALLEKLNGYLSGNIDADISFSGRQSMLSSNSFHRIKVDGDIKLKDIYYLSNDTVDMLSLDKVNLKFGDTDHHTGDTLFTASIKLDDAAFLHSQYSIKVSNLDLGVGALKNSLPADSNIVMPMGGELHLGKLGLTVLGDSILFDIRNTNGRLTLERFRQRPKQPLLTAALDVANLSVGTPDTRFMLSGSSIDIRALKLNNPKLYNKVKRAAEKIRRARPDLPLDSVYAHARYVATHKKKGPLPRVHPEMMADSTEAIQWGTSKFLRELLTGWRLKGSVKARRAGLFTPLFPVKNRMRNFNMSFTNDTVLLQDIKYKFGRSDFLLSGRVSNLARSLTSSTLTQKLKLNFELKSDTVDINELADATFRGSAYAAKRSDGRHAAMDIYSLLDDEELDDNRLEKELGRMVENAPNDRAPLMIPRNIDARFDFNAANVMYSDIHFRDLTGELMVAQGALNLHDIKASSDAGGVALSALYSSPDINNLKFGFGLDVSRFNIERFIKLVPAVDSVMPMLRDFSGIIDAEVAATCDIDQNMNLKLPSLDAAIRITGDSLAFINPETYRKIGKWLRFKDKESNIIKHMNVEMTVHDDLLQLYPFIFDLDRYRLGVEGYNDLSMNFNYHIAVLKSPLPFKFGVTIKGNPHKYHVRLGKARMNENQVARSEGLVDTVRINLLAQLEDVFRRGVSRSRFAKLAIADAPEAARIDLAEDTLTHADSIAFVREGLIPASELPGYEAATDSVATPPVSTPISGGKHNGIKAIFSRKRKTAK